ncbi:PspC domain-containing protein [Candidatus Falkowbacteria bacterium]|nr:PspC domain-containing protein [Candidatus Falkowbacteria bacterium]
MTEQSNRPKRSRADRIIFGVCGGLANHYELDATLIRILFILLALTNGVGIVLYLILAIMMPLEDGTEEGISREAKAKELAGEIGQKAKALGQEMKENQTLRWRSRNVFGGVVVFIGVIMLLERVAPFVFHWVNWGVIWPLLIIFLGLYLIAHKD